VERLLEWFDRNARELPWRSEPRDPYRVLVSELMLQQTQVDRVVPKFREFVSRFPDFETLARADEEEVLSAWSGLGYYRRARSLHRLSRDVVAGGGRLPTTSDDLRQLPGVGPYTAAAVASLAFGERVPVLDGNVIRVASRVLAFDGDPRRASGRRTLGRFLEGLVAEGPSGRVNEALMELGATVCLPSAPSCGSCPLADGCRAAIEGRPTAFPRPRPGRPSVQLRWVAACCIDPRGRWLVRRIEDGPILNGLWLPPIGSISDGQNPVAAARELVAMPAETVPEVLAEVEHAITHRRIRVTPVRWRLAHSLQSAGVDRWIEPESVSIGTSSLFHKLREQSDLHN
jgi:A/G-specific adenine glycosylase